MNKELEMARELVKILEEKEKAKKVNQQTNTVQNSSNRFDCLSEALKNKLISQDAICLEDESVNFANLDEEDMKTLKELKVI